MTPDYELDGARLHLADCLDAMAAMDEASVDAIVTDPPYGLEFMGKDWDKLAVPKPGNLGGFATGDKPSFERAMQGWHQQWAEAAYRVAKPGAHLLAFGGTRTHHRLMCALEDAGWEIRDCLMWLYGSGFPKSLDVSKAIDKAAGVAPTDLGESPNWRESKRDREKHGSMEVRGENAGRLTIPATDAAKQWNGWGTALKPAYEPIILARKPLVGTVAANVLSFGTGGLNIDKSRIQNGGSGKGSEREADQERCPVRSLRGVREKGTQVALPSVTGQVANDLREEMPSDEDTRGRKPVVEGRLLDTEEGRLPLYDHGRPVPERPETTSRATPTGGDRTPACDGADNRPLAKSQRTRPPHKRRQRGQPTGEPKPDGLDKALEGTPQGASAAGDSGKRERDFAYRTCGTQALGRWPANVVLDDWDAGAMLDAQSGERQTNKGTARSTHRAGAFGIETQPGRVLSRGDTGGASRFFYCAKASRSEREAGLDGRNGHPTVKPLALMRWLVRLVTPPNGLILDPFMGSGTTGIAAVLEGFRFVGVEQDADYLEIAKQRIAHHSAQPSLDI